MLRVYCVLSVSCAALLQLLCLPCASSRSLCGKNEVNLLCGDACPSSCHPGHCMAVGCYGHCNCIGGYVRVNKYNGPCVLRSECSRYANATAKDQLLKKRRDKLKARTAANKLKTVKPTPGDYVLDEAMLASLRQELPDWLLAEAADLESEEPKTTRPQKKSQSPRKVDKRTVQTNKNKTKRTVKTTLRTTKLPSLPVTQEKLLSDTIYADLLGVEELQSYPDYVLNEEALAQELLDLQNGKEVR